MSVYNIPNIDMSKVAIGNALRSSEDGSVSHQIKYNNNSLKVRIPVGIMKFYSLDPTFHHIHGQNEPLPNAMIGCKIVFKGCDPYGKERSMLNTSESLVYNFILHLQEKLTHLAMQDRIKIFGRQKAEELIREDMNSIKVDMKKGDGGFIPSGTHDPWMLAKISYTTVADHGHVNMRNTDDVRSDPYSCISPDVEKSEFCMIPYIMQIGNNWRITWKVEYDTTHYVFEV